MLRIAFALILAAGILPACKKSTAAGGSPTPEPATTRYYAWDQFVMGCDLSYVNQVEAYGGVYRDSGTVKDPYQVLKNHGANTVRVRLWHNPQWQAALNSGKLYNDLKDVEKTIQRAKALGMAVNLDLHYSDEWADPAKQKVPAAWAGLPLNILKDSVYNYTLAVLNYLKAKGLTPEMVQVGNETNQGMLFDAGKVVADNWVPFGTLLKSGIKAVRDFSTGSSIKPQIILHVAQLNNATYFTNGVMTKGGVTDFDILGVSHYQEWTGLSNLDQVAANIAALKILSGKKVMIVETAYPWTTTNSDSYPNVISGSNTLSGYPATKEGQFNYLKALTQQVINGGGSGVMYWEPAWISSGLRDMWNTGSSWDNCTLFDFGGNVLGGADFMRQIYKF